MFYVQAALRPAKCTGFFWLAEGAQAAKFAKAVQAGGAGSRGQGAGSEQVFKILHWDFEQMVLSH
jgi:hypothetical protein